jgi:hypothetical protein
MHGALVGGTVARGSRRVHGGRARSSASWDRR